MIFKREPEDGEKVQIKQIETGKSKSKKQVKKANKLRTTSYRKTVILSKKNKQNQRHHGESLETFGETLRYGEFLLRKRVECKRLRT